MKKFLLGCMLAFLALTGCKQVVNHNNQNVAADNYYFEQKQFDKLPLRPSIKTYSSLKELRQVFKVTRPIAAKRVDVDSVMAYAVINLEDHTCVVHTVDPAILYMPEYIGHEITHCLYGNFHPSQV